VQYYSGWYKTGRIFYEKNKGLLVKPNCTRIIEIINPNTLFFTNYAIVSYIFETRYVRT